MKLHKLTCPNCNGALDMKIAENTTDVFCPYCGQKFYLDDGKKEYTKNKNINIRKTIHNIYTDDAEVIKAQNKDKENKRSWIALIVLTVITIGIPFGMLAKFDIEEKVAVNEGKINGGFYRDLLDKDYKTVEAHFKAAGFTDIELIDLDDAGIAFWNDGKVETISIGGNTGFDSTDWFDPDTKVIISYH